MHEKLFSEAFHTPESTVLGLRLRNYAIGHELALIRRDNPLVTYSEKSFQELDLAMQKACLADAVEICCHRVPRIKLLWALRASRLPFGSELDKFRHYRAAGSLDLPTVKQPRTHGAPFHYFGAPELARLINYVTNHHAVMVNTHFEGSPLNFPLGLARILWATEMETIGAIWVENFHDYGEKKRRELYEQLHPESGVAVGEEAVRAAAKRWNLEHPDTPVPEN